MKNQEKKKTVDLGDNLGQRVTILREMRNMTVKDLARSCKFPIKRIEEIEAGIEIWLSFTDRTILARALGVQAALLKDVEASAASTSISEPVAAPVISPSEELAERILAGEVQIPCPKCGVILKTGIENALDFEGLPFQYARAYCPSCPYLLR